MKGFGLQQRRHPIIAHHRPVRIAITPQLIDLIRAGLVPGQHDVECVAIDGQELDLLRDNFGGVAARQRWRNRIARFGRSAANHQHGTLAVQQLEHSADQIKRALVGVAFLE